MDTRLLADDFRIVPCEHCGTEGRIISIRHRRWQEPEEVDHGECPVCEGSCSVVIRVRPVTLDDLERTPNSATQGEP